MRSFRRAAPASDVGDAREGAVATLDPPQGGTSAKVPRRRYDPAWDDWNPPRRWPGVLLSCVVVLGFLSVLIWHLRPSTPPVHHTKQVLKQGRALQKAYVVGNGRDVIKAFRGTGDQSKLGFSSNGSLMVLHAECACLYNFDLTIDQGFDQPVAIPISATGAYDTVLPVVLPVGTYQFQVVGTGPWTLTLVQPNASLPTIATSVTKPFSYYSDGDAVLGPFSSSDETLALAFLSSAQNTIEAQVLNAQGTVTNTPFFGHSPFLKKVTVQHLPNPFYLSLTDVGFWQVLIEPPTVKG